MHLACNILDCMSNSHNACTGQRGPRLTAGGETRTRCFDVLRNPVFEDPPGDVGWRTHNAPCDQLTESAIFRIRSFMPRSVLN